MVVHLVANQVTGVRFPLPAHPPFGRDERGSPARGEAARSVTMRITSPAFEHNRRIPGKYTCDGENVNPPLSFSEVPKNTKSLVLIVDDPDAPSKTASNAAGAWVHWVVYNIDSATREVSENSVPRGGQEGLTDFGNPGYGGPCPPSGNHRYFFKLYALDSALNLSQKSDKQSLFANKKAVEEAMQGYILDSTELVGLYERKR